MFNPHLARFRSLAAGWGCWLALALGGHVFAAESWNLAVLDQLCAGVTPGQKLAQVGDMQIQVGLLQAWRNRLAGLPQPQLAFDASVTTWPGGIVYYAFSNNVSAAKQAAFLDGAAEWATFARLQFVPRTQEANYVMIFEGAGLEGGQSAVGMVGGEQFLSIGPTSWNRPTICHELGHTLGLIHEQQRSDRDNYVTILTNNILPGEEGNFVLIPGSANTTPYDFLSVMEYSRNALSVSPGLDTIEPLAPYDQFINLMGVQFDPVLSVSDRAGMALVYGAGPPLTNWVTTTRDSGPGSLRAALYYAFDHPGSTIHFGLPAGDPGFSNQVFNVRLSDALPGLVHATTLDGGTEPVQANPHGPAILLDGSPGQALSVYASGLQFKGSNCVARALVINGFTANGVWFTGAAATSNRVSGCYLGTDPAGLTAVTSGYCPVEIDGGASGNLVGGSAATDRNVISGSGYQGVVMRDPGTVGNVIAGNYIGLNAPGTAALPNTWAGVEIFGGAQSNWIGGAAGGAGNVISGNTLQGVAIADSTTSGNVVAGNFIGLNPAGTAALPNGYAGVEMFNGAFGNLIGGTIPGAGNVISGNLDQGISISATGAVANVVQGNWIGLAAAGNFGIPNGGAGVAVFGGAQSNLIGGEVSAARNVISGNGMQGVAVADPGTSGNVIEGNYIGANPAGTVAVSNAWAGVNFFGGATGNRAGGPAPGAGNLISGNGIQGVLIQDAGTDDNAVQGNLIGLDATGLAALPNAASGVEIYNGPSGNQIGGLGSARNFISGNGGYGVDVDFGSSGNFIQGNTIGLDALNQAVVANGGAPVLLYVDAAANLVGGVTPGSANIITGSPADGVQVFYAGSTNNTIRGNSIYGNAGQAILLYSGGDQNLAAPGLSSAVVGLGTVVDGSYTGWLGAQYQLDFYADAPGGGEAQARTYLGAAAIAGTGAAAAFTVQLGSRLPAGRQVTATVTDPAGNTSGLSLPVSATLTSTVNDGIPDVWRAFYFGGSGAATNRQSAAGADPDGDGVSNWQEFLAGTNPTNPASAFRLAAYDPRLTTNNVVIQSEPGIIYRVEYRDAAADGSWSLLADQVAGTGGALPLADPSAAASAHRFYRAEVLW